jgi:Protein of unknown function (DUF1493)
MRKSLDSSEQITMSEDPETRVRDFVTRELGVSRACITSAARLSHDLGCDGEDARELLRQFAVQFSVDLSGFELSRHFGPEAAFNPLLYLYWRLRRPERLRFVPLTVGDLVEAVRTGALRHPVRAAV